MSTSDEDPEEAEAVVKELGTTPDEKEVVLSVEDGDVTIEVTRAAKNSMILSLEVDANQPTIFFRCHATVTAVCAILGLDLVDYSFREGPEFDWNDVIPGRKDTHPQAATPSDEEYR